MSNTGRQRQRSSGQGLLSKGVFVMAAMGIALAVSVTLAQVFNLDDAMTQASERAGAAVSQMVKRLQRYMNTPALQGDADALKRVNDFYNKSITYGDDQTVWGVPDYWATPFETFKRGSGDCEDYVIAKYFTLVHMGMPHEKLRFVYVRAKMPHQAEPVAHMVLAYYSSPAAEPLILDILIDDIQTASRRTDLTPVFSFNAQALWQGVGTQSQGSASARLSKWREVMEKVKLEGFVF